MKKIFKNAQRKKSRALRDLVIIFITIFVFVFAAIFDIHERFIRWARAFGEGFIRIEELTIVLAILAFAFSIFSLRRWREFRVEITERKQVDEKMLQRNRELSVLYTIDRATMQALDLEKILNDALKATLDVLEIEAGGIYLLNPDREILTLRVHRGVSDEFVKNVKHVKFGEGISGRAAAEKRPVVLDVMEYPAERWAPFILQEGIKTLASTPLLSGGGELVGAMNLVMRRPRTFSQEEYQLLVAVGQQLGGIVKNAQLYEKVKQELVERKRAEEALLIERERLETVTQSMGAGLAIISRDYRTIWANKVLKDLFGDVEAKICHLTYNQRNEICPGCGVREIFETEKDEVVHEQSGKDIHGNIIWSEIIATPIRDNAGYITAALELVVPVTERKRIEREKANLEEQLRQSQKMEAIGRLAGGVAHDFNNLLTVIKGYSQLSLLELKEDDPLKENIEEIKRATERAADLTRQLLAFSRRQILEVKVLDLNTILKNLDKMLRRVIGEDIELVTLLAEDLGMVKSDPGQIEQVVMNLAVNARDAMPNGGKLTIETANVELDEEYARAHIAVKPGCYVMLSVSDTGIGMTPEVKERVFEPFFTTKEKSKGTGLGLSTVYGIVKQSEGNIWVYSELGKGTTFKIYLPRVDEPLEEVTGEVVKKELPRGGETILIVEDNEEVRKLAARILKKQGYTVLEGSHGDEALNVCKQHKGPIHLMVTDVVMPGMSGRELSERLKPLYPQMKVLYMSGYTDNAITHHGVLEKGVNYIQKPFTVDGLARKVREVLDK